MNLALWYNNVATLYGARVVAPRFWAGVFSMPLLAALFSMVGVVMHRVFVRVLKEPEGDSVAQPPEDKAQP